MAPKPHTLALALALLAQTVLASSAARAAEIALAADLTPAHTATIKERPGAGQPGAAGSFAARLDPATGELCTRLAWSGLERVTMAHIHALAAGPDGAPLIAFEELESGAPEHCQAIGRTLAEQLAAQPGAFYVMVHTEDHPSGAISGAVERR